MQPQSEEGRSRRFRFLRLKVERGNDEVSSSVLTALQSTGTVTTSTLMLGALPVAVESAQVFAKSIDAAVRAVKSAQNGITGRSNLNSRNPWCQANYQNQEYRTSVQLLEAQTTVEVVTVEQQIK